MAKLVDALCSGRSARKGVLVRIQFWAQKRLNGLLGLFLTFSKAAPIPQQVCKWP